MAEPSPLIEEQAAPARAGVAADVRRLIGQVESGAAFDAEWSGHAFDVLEDMSAALDARLGSAAALARELQRRAERFARASATSNMYMRLVVTDSLPDLPDYAPCDIGVYDGVQSGGTDFSKVVQRSTVYGTLMTSVNVTDLRAYFESGKKRRLLVYLGTDRLADINALDNMLAQLPAALELMGFDKKAVAEILAAIRAGDVPPVVMKALASVVEIAKLSGTAAKADAPPELQARLAGLETQIRALAVRIAAMPSVAPVFAKMFARIAAMPVLAVFLPTVVPVRAHNDNGKRMEGAAQTATVRELVKVVREAAREKALPPAMRRELAVVLRDLRQGLSKTAPQPARFAPAIVRLAAVAVPYVGTVNPPPFIRAVTPVLLRAVVANTTPAFRAETVRPVLVNVLKDVPAMPAKTIARMDRILQTNDAAAPARVVTALPRLAEAVPVRAAAKILSELRVSDIVPPVIKMAVPRTQINAAAEKAPPAAPADGIRRNADGTVMDCCKPKFNETAALKSALDAAPKQAVSGPALNVGPDGGITFTDSKGRVINEMTKAEVQANIEGHAELDRRLETVRPSPAMEKMWEAETRALLQAAPDAGAQNIFNHICTAGCNHGTAPKLESLGTVIAQDDAVLKVTKVKEDVGEAVPKGRPKRTLRIA